ncbi:MAG: energy transducer TonB [Sediminibacterium sp.]|nr:energy transducer TonB [Sediminibacterium sp.]
MEKSNILSADLLDILFDGRNKKYGAYQLRRTYDRRIGYALSGTFFLCLLFTVGSILANGKKKTIIDNYGPVVELTDIEPPVKPKEIPRPIEKPAPTIAMVKDVVPLIVPDIKFKPEDEIPPVEELVDPQIGNKNMKGIITDVVAPPVEVKGLTLEPPHTASGDEPGFITTQMNAQFPGGVDGWRKYLERNLNKDLPSDNGAPPGTYTVTVSFVVDVNGMISDVKAENDPGYGTAAEAIKVIKKGPNWSPAEQNGKKVIYRQKQNITFRVSVE